MSANHLPVTGQVFLMEYDLSPPFQYAWLKPWVSVVNGNLDAPEYLPAGSTFSGLFGPEPRASHRQYGEIRPCYANT